jgi:integrase
LPSFFCFRAQDVHRVLHSKDPGVGKMAIHLYCPKCYTSNGLESKNCSNCHTPFGRDKRYRVSVSVKGKRFTRVVDNLTVAREVERTAASDMVREEFDVTHHRKKERPLILGELWEQHYLPWAKDHKRTWRDDEWNYQRHLQPRFAAKALASISSLDIERMKADMRKAGNGQGKPYAAQTIKHQVVLLRRLFNLARKWKLYQGENPVSGVQLPRIDNQVTEFLTDDELARLRDTLDNWPFDDTAAFVKFALLTGFRRGELFKLKWEHVDISRGLVTIVDPKGKKTTTVPVCQEALDVLSRLHRSCEFVFPGRNGQQRSDFKGPWLRIRKAAGLPDNIRFHGLRHHFASTLVSNGVDLAVVRELLTHKDMSTTLRYAHLQPDAVKRAAQKAGELLQPRRKTTVIQLNKE